MKNSKNPQFPFWTLTVENALSKKKSSLKGLSTKKALTRIEEFGPNSIKTPKEHSSIKLFLNQFKNPITLILIFAASISLFLQDSTNAIIILIIILFSTILGFWQEKTAGDAVSKLLNLIHITSTVLRDGKKSEISLEEIVPGDIIFLNAGDVIPADCLLIKEDELFIDEAAFTGETFPVEKEVSVLSENTPLKKRKNA